MKTLTIAFVTSRENSCIDWFHDSLMRQIPGDCALDIIIVDGFNQTGKKRYVGPFEGRPNINVIYTEPKPTIWQGPHRITSCDWWAKCNALNTAICLCETPWLAFVDDRCVLAPYWIYCIEQAMAGEYAVCGNYEKHARMNVVNGEFIDSAGLLGKDNRTQSDRPYPTQDWYGGSGALPLEWCLAVNGFAELCDSLGLEDAMFGVTLRNSGYPIMYDPRMLIIEDRTPGEIDGALKRADWGISPNDASHKIVEILRDKTTSQNSFDIRNVRDRVLAGEPWPTPTDSTVHWFSGEPIPEKFNKL